MLVSESLHHFVNEEFIAYQILNERFDIIPAIWLKGCCDSYPYEGDELDCLHFQV